jgi:hypothetical protein
MTTREPKRDAKFDPSAARYEPLYDINPHTETVIEIFHAERMFGGMKGAGWHWWASEAGSVPPWPPIGPFATAYRAFRDALINGGANRVDAP